MNRIEVKLKFQKLFKIVENLKEISEIERRLRKVKKSFRDPIFFILSSNCLVRYVGLFFIYYR